MLATRMLFWWDATADTFRPVRGVVATQRLFGRDAARPGFQREGLMEEVEKQPTENWAFPFRFRGRLPTGLSLQSGVASAIRLDTMAVDNSVLASTAVTIDGTDAIIRLQAGSPGVSYKITVLVTLSDSLTVLEENVLMPVVDR